MTLKRIYRLLRPIGDSVVDRAMGEALPTADPEAQHMLVLSLLARHDETARLDVIRHLHLLPPALQQVVVVQAHRLDAVLRAAAEHPEPTTRLNVVDLVVRSQSFRLAYLLSAQLHHSDSRVRRAAGAGLLNLVHLLDDEPAHAGRGDATSDRAESTAAEAAADAEPSARVSLPKAQCIRWLAAALIEGCSCYHQHGRQDVIAACAALGPASPRGLIQQLTDRRCAAHPVLREMIRQPERPEIQQGLLTFAALATLESTVVEALAHRGAWTALPMVLPTAHLLAVPDVRLAVRKISRGSHLLPTEPTLAGLPLSVQRLVPRWTAAVRGDERAERAEALRPLVIADDAVTRLLTLRTLREIDDPAADDQIATLCFDREPAIARLALRHLRRRQWPGLTRMMAKLVGSPHTQVRRFAERELASVGFERLWRYWGQMDAATQQTAGRAVMKIDRRFHEQLAQKLRSADADDRFKAVMMVRALEQESDHETRLTELLKDADEKVASASAGALGVVGESAEVGRGLADALHHEDDRVRANAIESLDSLGRTAEADERLKELAGDSGNRSRAAAIAALMKLPLADALPELMKMLTDDRPEHRVSALWVVQDLGLVALARQVVDLARHDDDREIRRRALDVYRQILRTNAPADAVGSEVARGTEARS